MYPIGAKPGDGPAGPVEEVAGADGEGQKLQAFADLHHAGACGGPRGYTTQPDAIHMGSTPFDPTLTGMLTALRFIGDPGGASLRAITAARPKKPAKEVLTG